MKTLTNAFLSHLRAMGKLQRALYLTVCFLLALYMFSMFAFSARAKWNYVNLGIGIALLLSIFVYALLYDGIRFDRYFLILFGFCTSVIVSGLLQGGAFSLNKSLFLQAIFGWVLFQFVKSKKDFHVTTVFLLLGGFAFCVYYFVHYRYELIHFTFTSSSNRLGAFFDNQNNIARDFVLISLLATYLGLSKKQWYLLLVLPITAYFILSTGSISNLICMALAFIVMLFLFLKGKKRLIAIAVLIGLVGAAIGLLQLPQLSYFRTRIFGMIAALFGGGNADGSAMERYELARDAFIFFLDSPLFGHGPGYVATHTQGGFAHNNLAELLANYGLFGCLFFECLLIIPFIDAVKCKTPEAKFSVTVLVYLILFQFFLVTYYQKIDHTILALVFGALANEKQGYVSIRWVRKPIIDFHPSAWAKKTTRGNFRPMDKDAYDI